MGGQSTEWLFPGTNAASKYAAGILLDIPLDEPTATVWSHITTTGSNYPGTQIPRSFCIATDNGTFWTHGNATEHMNEAVASLTSALGNSNPYLYSQFILYDYRKALTAATREGVQYNKSIKSGHWTFRISKSRSTDKYPAVVHALFTGLK